MANSKNKSFDRRSEDEKAEGYDVKQNDLPGDRFQNDKQVLKPEELGTSSSSIPGTDKAVTTSNMKSKSASAIKSKIKIRPDVSVDELKNKQVGGVPIADTVGVLRSAAGVSNVSAASDSSKIPYSGGGYRPSTRYGKKRSDDLFEMDNTISEQIVPTVEDDLDLAESPDSKQGYNGRKQFKQTRGKKNFKRSITATVGGTSTVFDSRLPQQLLNESSVDFVHVDKVVYSTGQILDSIQDKANYPQVAYSTNSVDRPIDKSNYKPTALNITLTNGKISAISISEDRYVTHANPLIQDEANMNWQIDQNNVAHTMIKLQTELGRETTEKWSPLGYVIDQPYEYNMLMHDIEATTGAIMATAYRSAVSSLAYQKNILAKDGINPQRNAVKMIAEGYAGILADTSSDTLKTGSFSTIFDKHQYALGSAAALIDMFDTTKKYRSKADILGLQRSFGLHLAKADNNINPLHCKPEFIKALDKAHLFSTPDGNYNPMLPIWSTRVIKLINPLSLNVFLANWKHPTTLDASDLNDSRRNKDTGTYALYQYNYADIRNNYTTNVFHPIVEGLLMWLLKYEGAMASTYGSSANITIPWEFNMECPNMLSFLLCSAAQYVLFQRNIIFRDVLFAGEQETYIWDDLTGLDKLNPLYSSQLKIGTYTDPLTLGKMASDTLIREMWGTHMNLADYQSGGGTNMKAQYFMPWYFNEQSMKDTWDAKDGFKNEQTAWNMSIPSVRDGVRHEYVDLIKSMGDRDIRLALDRWLDFPYNNVVSMKTVHIGALSFSNVYAIHTPDLTAAKINDYIKLSAVRYDTNSDGRLAATYQFEDTTNVMNVTGASIYCIPKELGWISDAYDGFTLITKFDEKKDTDGKTDIADISQTPVYEYTTADSCNFYDGFSSTYLTSYRVQADSDTSNSIDRSAALTQVAYNFFATSHTNTQNLNYIKKIGVLPCWSGQKYTEVYPAYVNIKTDTPSTTVLDNVVCTLSKGIWSMLQRFFMPVNKFENCFTHNTSLTAFDPMENCFYFGVCGTLASDYTQDILERLDVCDQLGLDYTEDVFAKDSLLLR